MSKRAKCHVSLVHAHIYIRDTHHHFKRIQLFNMNQMFDLLNFTHKQKKKFRSQRGIHLNSRL